MDHEGDDISITTLSERPELGPSLLAMAHRWPAFMLEDPVADLYYTDVETSRSEFVLVATPRAEPLRPIARGYSVPFAFGADVGRDRLPPDGWDRVVRWSFGDRARGTSPTAVSALDITIEPSYLGRNLSIRILTEMRDNARRLGFRDLFAPVRPTAKEAEPLLPMRQYVTRRRADGLPADPWLRVHVRAGGRVVGVCPTSMTVTGTPAQWRSWTGLPFDVSGAVVVPHALVPVKCDIEHDQATYVEPNVWVHHRTDGTAPDPSLRVDGDGG